MPDQPIDLSSQVHAERDRRVEVARGLFDDLLAWAREPAQALALAEVERTLLARLMQLGVALIGVWLAEHLPTSVPRRIRVGRGWYSYQAFSGDTVRTRFGELWAPRPVYTRVGGHGPAWVAPEDGAIGLADGRMSLGVHLLVAWLAARMAFDDVGETIEQFGGYAPSKRAALGIVDEIGPQAAAWMQAMPVPEDDGDIIVVQVDGKGAPMLGTAEHSKRCRPHMKGPRGRGRRRQRRREQPRARRGKGQRSKNARMATVAVIYTLRRLPDGTLEGPLNKRIIATFGPKRRLFELALREARQRGYGTKPTYFLADGDRALWKLQREFFPEATPCLDWYHACEYLWAAGTAAFAEGSRELAAWVHQRQGELLEGQLEAVLDALRAVQDGVGRSGPGTRGRRERVQAALTFLDNHRDQLQYHKLRGVDMDIATGAVEGAINYIIGRRLDGSMMRWSPARADHVLALRCVQYNGHWKRFAAAVEHAHAARGSPVIGRITPQHRQTPYDAVRKAA